MRPLQPNMNVPKQRPKLADYRIPEGFDFEAHASDLKTAEDRSWRVFFASQGVIALVIAVLASDDLDIVGILLLAVSIWIPIMFLSAMLNLFEWTEGLIVRQTEAGKIEPRVAKYLRAKEDWEYHNLTTRRGFWKKLRGVDLENAVARLFREQDWLVETTAVTGDGGVDLKIGRGGSQRWVQCKGYAKPVSVAAVREIAGVCSSCTAKPMLIVVNGVTKPALSEANNLGVTVWDSEQLAQFAKGQC